MELRSCFLGVKELKELRQMPYCLKSKKKAVVLTPQRPQEAITPLTP